MSNAVQKNAAWPRTDAFDYSTAGLFLFFFIIFILFFLAAALAFHGDYQRTGPIANRQIPEIAGLSIDLRSVGIRPPK